jgi:hypothetical protein
MIEYEGFDCLVLFETYGKKKTITAALEPVYKPRNQRE